MMVVDAIMVGRFSTQELAYQAIGLAPLMFIMVTSFGSLMGTLVRTAYNVGRQAGKLRRCVAAFAFDNSSVNIGHRIYCVLLRHAVIPHLDRSRTDIAEGGGEVILILDIAYLYAGFYHQCLLFGRLETSEPGTCM